MAIPYHNYNALFLILRHSFKKSLLIMKQYMIIRNYGKMLFSYVLQTLRIVRTTPYTYAVFSWLHRLLYSSIFNTDCHFVSFLNGLSLIPGLLCRLLQMLCYLVGSETTTPTECEIHDRVLFYIHIYVHIWMCLLRSPFTMKIDSYVSMHFYTTYCCHSNVAK